MNVRTFCQRHRRLFAYLCAAGWITCFAGTHIPQEHLPGLGSSDKALHLVGYAGLAILFWLALWAYGCRMRRRLGLVLVTLAVYAAVDEITQPLVNRYACVADWYADCAGAAIGAAVCEGLALLWRRKR